jgi:hypothetical protein
MRHLLAALLFVVSWPAFAAPPPAGSEDAKIMAPFKEWVTSQHDTSGRWCCDIGDGRPVEARIDGDHWAAHITLQHFPDTAQVCPGPVAGPGSAACVPLGPDGVWATVPDEKVTRNANPTGAPILWLYQGRVQCFAPPDGV